MKNYYLLVPVRCEMFAFSSCKRCGVQVQNIGGNGKEVVIIWSLISEQNYLILYLQGDQLYMAVCFRCLVKGDFSMYATVQ